MIIKEIMRVITFGAKEERIKRSNIFLTMFYFVICHLIDVFMTLDVHNH